MRNNICMMEARVYRLELFPEDIRVVRVEPEQNMYRFYRLRRQADLFGGVTLFREWGRIGTSGRQKTDSFEDAGQAANALLALVRTKKQRGLSDVSTNGTV